MKAKCLPWQNAKLRKFAVLNIPVTDYINIIVFSTGQLAS